MTDTYVGRLAPPIREAVERLVRIVGGMDAGERSAAVLALSAAGLEIVDSTDADDDTLVAIADLLGGCCELIRAVSGASTGSEVA